MSHVAEIGGRSITAEDAWRLYWATLFARVTGHQSALRERLPERARNQAAAYHIADILDSLEEYWLWIRRLKKRDIDTYNLFTKVGGVIMPGRLKLSDDEIDGRLELDPRTWPAFGMASFPSSLDPPDDRDVFFPRLLYFHKIEKRNSRIAYIPSYHSAVCYYEVCLYYTDKDRDNYGIGNYAMCADSLGNIHATRVVMDKPQVIRHKRRAPGTSRTSHLQHRVVDFAPFLKGQAERHKTTIDKTAANIFRLTLAATVAALDGIQVNLERGGLMGRFGIPISRSAYFFKDRAFEANVAGSRKKIFHYVERHSRELVDGRRVPVRQHYRGAREFEWHGTKVVLTVPDYHHNRFDTLTKPAWLGDDDAPIPSGFMTSAELGDKVREYIMSSPQRGRGGVARG